MNLFASSNNNPVILPGECVSCLMPLYAVFFTMPKSLFTDLVCRGGKQEAENAFLFFFYFIVGFVFLAGGWPSPPAGGRTPAVPLQRAIGGRAVAREATAFPTAISGSCGS